METIYLSICLSIYPSIHLSIYIITTKKTKESNSFNLVRFCHLYFFGELPYINININTYVYIYIFIYTYTYRYTIFLYVPYSPWYALKVPMTAAKERPPEPLPVPVRPSPSRPWHSPLAMAPIKFIGILLAHWIGLRENLQETMVFTIKYRAFL